MSGGVPCYYPVASAGRSVARAVDVWCVSPNRGEQVVGFLAIILEALVGVTALALGVLPFLLGVLFYKCEGPSEVLKYPASFGLFLLFTGLSKHLSHLLFYKKTSVTDSRSQYPGAFTVQPTRDSGSGASEMQAAISKSFKEWKRQKQSREPGQSSNYSFYFSDWCVIILDLKN